MEGINRSGKAIPLMIPNSEIAVCLSNPFDIKTNGNTIAISEEVNELAVFIKVMGALEEIKGFK